MWAQKSILMGRTGERDDESVSRDEGVMQRPDKAGASGGVALWVGFSRTSLKPPRSHSRNSCRRVAASSRRARVNPAKENATPEGRSPSEKTVSSGVGTGFGFEYFRAGIG